MPIPLAYGPELMNEFTSKKMDWAVISSLCNWVSLECTFSYTLERMDLLLDNGI